MNYYIQKQKKKLAERRQKEADLAERLRKEQRANSQAQAKKWSSNTSTPVYRKSSKINLPPPPPPDFDTSTKQWSSANLYQSNLSPGGTDLGNWVCVTCDNGKHYYYHKVGIS